MADTKMNQDKTNEQLRSQANQSGDNQTMRHEQAKGQFSGQSGEKSAIGGGSDRSQTGEPGRARNELDEKSRSETGQKSEFDKSRSEPTGSR